jgi:hypothetical protein
VRSASRTYSSSFRSPDSGLADWRPPVLSSTARSPCEARQALADTVSVYSDITELKQREQDLTEKSNALTALSAKLAKYLAPQVYGSIFTGLAAKTASPTRVEANVESVSCGFDRVSLIAIICADRKPEKR